MLAPNSLISDLWPQFHLARGGMSYANDGEGGRPETAKYSASRWNSLLVQNEFLAQTTPLMLTLGNREMEK
ncbi:hypothetical protein [Lentzea sp. NPDC055074]